MTSDNWHHLTNGLMLVVVVFLWLDKRRERRKSDEAAALMRARHSIDRVGFDNVKGRP